MLLLLITTILQKLFMTLMHHFKIKNIRLFDYKYLNILSIWLYRSVKIQNVTRCYSDNINNWYSDNILNEIMYRSHELKLFAEKMSRKLL